MTFKIIKVIPNSQQTYDYCVDALQTLKDNNFIFKYHSIPVYGGKQQFTIVFDSDNIGLISQITNLASLGTGRTKINGSTYIDYIDRSNESKETYERQQNAQAAQIKETQDTHDTGAETSLKADILDLQLNELTAEEILALSFEEAHQHHTIISRQADVINQYLHENNLDDTEANITAAKARTDLPTGTKRMKITPPQ